MRKGGGEYEKELKISSVENELFIYNPCTYSYFSNSNSHVDGGGKVPECVGPVERLKVVESAGVVVQQVTQEG